MLTHRPHDANRLLPSRWMEGAWPFNAWLGVTVEGPPYVDRVREALKAPAPVHFISFEPALEAVDFSSILGPQSDRLLPVGERRASWLIAGCESGQHPRPMPLSVAENVMQQCRNTGAKFFMKQLNAELLGLGRKNQVIEDLARFPAHLRVREFPRMPRTLNLFQR
jgi:protein gp37